METILTSALLLVFLLGAVLLYKDYYVKLKFRKTIHRKYKVIEPLIRTLARKEVVHKMEILMLVKDPSIRHAVLLTLEGYDRKDLFPAEYFTREKAAEGFLVNWLEFPTELGRAPEDIELFAKIMMMEAEALDYYVFKFRSSTPSWAAKRSWMMGVCGPYRTESMPYDIPRRVFSRFNTLDSISPETEVQWVHRNIGQ